MKKGEKIIKRILHNDLKKLIDDLTVIYQEILDYKTSRDICFYIEKEDVCGEIETSIDIYYVRDETPKEEMIRIEQEKRQLETHEREERELYLRLKNKFENMGQA